MSLFAPPGRLDPLKAYDLLSTFARGKGPLPLRLAMHTAVPQGFRFDLLHLLKLNFVPEAAGDRTVEADVMLADICQDLGGGYFEFDPEIRRLLLDSLVDNYAGEPASRVRRVANFLLWYVEQFDVSPYDHKNRLWRDYLEIQRWVAMGFREPERAAYQLAAALDRAETEDVSVRVRLGGLASVLSTPLVQHERLLTYAVGLQALETGQYGQAQALLTRLGEQPLTVGDITLRSPAAVLNDWRGRRRGSAPPSTTIEKTSDQAASEALTNEPVDEGVLNTLTHRLGVNLNILQERAANYADDTPAELLGQIETYIHALKLVIQARDQKSPAAALQAQLEELDLGLDFDVTRKYYPNLFTGYESTEDILQALRRNLDLLKEREAQSNPPEVPLELLNRIYDYEQVISAVERAIDERNEAGINALLTRRNYDITPFSGDMTKEMTDAPAAVPFQAPPLPDFLRPRPNMLKLLTTHLLTEEPTGPTLLAIVGQRGLGKTTMATLVAHEARVRRHFSDGVLWATLGETPDLSAILSGWIEALGGDSPPSPPVETAARRLQDLLQEKVALLILDDVRDEAQALPLLVDTPHCRTLVACRDTGTAQRLGAKHYELPLLMTENQALSLVEGILGYELHPPDRRVMAQLVDLLLGLPLTLGLAAEFIKQGMSPSELLTALESKLSERNVVISKTNTRRDREAVLEALEAIRQEHFSADAAVLAPSSNNYEVFISYSRQDADFVSQLQRELTARGLTVRVEAERLDDAAALSPMIVEDIRASTLCLFILSAAAVQANTVRQEIDLADKCDKPIVALIWQPTDASFLFEHRLSGQEIINFQGMFSQQNFDTLALILYRRLGDGAEPEQAIGYHEQALRLARQLGDREETEVSLRDLAREYKNSGHLEQAIACNKQLLDIRRNVNKPGVGNVLYRLGELYHELGQVSEAVAYFEEALAVARELNDPHDQITRLNSLGDGYRDIGQLTQAIAWYEKALQVARDGGSEYDEHVAFSNLGRAYRDLGQLEQATNYYREALAIARKIDDPPAAAFHLRCLAEIYADSGQMKQAIGYYEQALAIARKLDDPQKQAADLSNLGAAYRASGQVDRARSYYEQALTIREKQLGPEHPDTAESWHDLGAMLADLGDYEAARSCSERALAIREKVLGPDHPHIAQSLNNLGGLLREMGDYEGARPYYERALAIREKVLGPDHPDTAASLNNLGALLYSQGVYEVAQPYYERALAIREKILGPDHPHTATSLNNLGNLFSSQGAYEAARSSYERALAIREKVLGPDHPHTAQSLNNLGFLLSRQGAYEAAQPYYEQALAIFEKELGADHPYTAQSLNNLGNLLSSQGAYEAALPYYERALAIREKVLGADHPHTAVTLNNLGNLFSSQGAYEAARSSYERALAIREKVLGPDHSDTAESLYDLGALLADLGDYEAARSYYDQALAIQDRLGDLKGRSATLHAKANILTRRGHLNQALQLYDESLAIRDRLGDLKGRSTTLHEKANVLARRGHLEQALQLYDESLTIQDRLGDLKDRSATLHAKAYILALRGELEQALQLYDESLTIEDRLGDLRGKAATLAKQGQVYQLRGDEAAARRAYETALAIFEQLELPEAEQARQLLAGLDQPPPEA